MEIVVLVKHVPDIAEAELSVDRSGRALDMSDLGWVTNEWDDFAVEAAVQLKEAHGGRVRVVTLGHEDAEEVLRRALAMGCDEALHLRDPAFQTDDPQVLARYLAAAVGAEPFDLVLCGAIAADDGHGQVGGAVAAWLDVPCVALATGLEVEGAVCRVRHEVEGGLEREVEVDLPAVVTVQTGLNEPRYVSIRGIRKVAAVDIPVRGMADIALPAETVDRARPRVEVVALEAPPAGKGAEILEGDAEAAVDLLVQRLREKGGLL